MVTKPYNKELVGNRSNIRSQHKSEAKAKSTKEKVVRLPLPEFPGVSLSSSDIKDCEPLVHNDLHISLVQQAIDELDARCLVVWTSGSGTPLLAGVMSEVPTVGFVLNETHLQATAYEMDAKIAQRLQLEGNPLYDKDLAQLVRRALAGNNDSGDEDGRIGKEKANKGKKREASEGTSGSNSEDVKDKKHKKDKDKERDTGKKETPKKADKGKGSKSITEMLMGPSGKQSKQSSEGSSEESGTASDSNDSS